MTAPKSAAQKCAQACGLTLGTDQANAVITGFELGHAAGVEDARELMEVLGRWLDDDDYVPTADIEQALTRLKALAGEE